MLHLSAPLFPSRKDLQRQVSRDREKKVKSAENFELSSESEEEDEDGDDDVIDSELPISVDHFGEDDRKLLDRAIPSGMKDDTFLEIKGERAQIKCKVLQGVQIANEWRTAVSQSCDYSKVESEFCSLYDLTENEKLSEVLRSFPEDVVEKKLVGIILNNYEDNLTLAEDFLGEENVQDIFVCVVSRSHHYRLKSLMEGATSETKVRVIHSSSVDSQELAHTTGSKVSGDRYSVESMMTFYFSMADHNDLDIALYGHIFSYFDNVSKEFTDQKKGLKILLSRLEKDNFQLAHFILYSALVYKMNRKGQYWSVKCPRIVKKCTKRLFNALRDVLKTEPLRIAQIVEEHLLYENLNVCDGRMEKPFFHLLGDACMKMADLLRSFGKSSIWLGLEMMWITLHLKFMEQNGSNVEQLKTVWTDFLTQQPKHNQESFWSIEVSLITCAYQLGRLLELPTELQFSGRHLGELIVSVRKIQSVTVLRGAIEQFESMICSSGDYLTDFLETSQYLLVRRSELSDIPAGLISVVEGGPAFIILVTKQLMASGTTNSRFIHPLLWYWEEILSAMMTRDPAATVKMVKELDQQFRGNNKVASMIKDAFDDKFKAKLSENNVSMQLGTFAVYLEAITDNRFPRELVQQYLDVFIQNMLPNAVQLLATADCRDFFTAYHSRWSRKIPVDDQIRFTNFIFKASVTYPEDKKLQFVKDLLNLKHVPIVAAKNANEVHESFNTKLLDFIRNHRLGTSVCDILHEAMVRTDWDHFTKVDELVYEVMVKMVCEGIGTHYKQLTTNPTAEMRCVNTASAKLYDFYSRKPHMWASPPSVPISWYWNIVNRLCKVLEPNIENFNWLKDSSGPISVVASVYGVYMKSKGKVNEIPPDVIQYQYFQWVSVVQSFLHHWKHHIEEGKCTVSQLKEYKLIFQEWNVRTRRHLEAEGLILSKSDIERKISEFEKAFEDACNLLLIDGKYSLLGILSKFDVTLPPELSSSLVEVFTDTVCFSTTHLEEKPQHRAELHLSVLKNLVDDLRTYSAPLARFKEFVVHFSLKYKGNHFFEAFFTKVRSIYQPSSAPSSSEDSNTRLKAPYNEFPGNENQSILIEPQRVECSMSMEVFCKILSATMQSLKNLLTGNTTYEDLKDLGLPNHLNEKEITEEFEIVTEYKFEGISRFADMGGIKEIILFQQFRDFLEHLQRVCQLYNLSTCLQDGRMVEMMEILEVLKSDEQMMKLTPVQARQNLTKIHEHLQHPGDNINGQCVRLFEVAMNSEDFAKFLKDRNFAGQSGSRLFNQNVELLTANLQYEEFQEDILNNLRIAYEFMSPFLTPEIDLGDFLHQVFEVCKIYLDTATDAFCQLSNVNRNIDLIYLWFSRTEGNPMEEFRDISENGHFEFVSEGFRPYSVIESVQDEIEIVLKFSSSKKGALDDQRMVDVVWKKEQIDDFIRQLGLLEKGKEKEVETFLDLYKIANKMLHIQTQLRNLGYQGEISLELSCNCSLDKAVENEQHLGAILKDWQDTLSTLDSGCPNLLLLSTPKILRMYSILHEVSSAEDMMSHLAKEMAFASGSHKNLKTLLEDCLKQIQEHSSSEEMFLQALKDVCKNSLPSPETEPFADTEPRFILHLATNCSPKDLFGIILSIHGPHPKAYQILRCHHRTTSEEIDHFFKRAQAFQLTFTLVTVNLLPARLQEHLVQLHNQAVQTCGHCQLHYVATGSTILQNLPKITVQDHTSHKGINWDEGAISFADEFTKNSQMASVKLVHGKAGDTRSGYLIGGQHLITDIDGYQLAANKNRIFLPVTLANIGDGKSHYIRKKMSESKESDSVIITINESFSPLMAITKLNGLELVSNNVIHFNITWLPSLDVTGGDMQHKGEKTDDGSLIRLSNISNEVEWFFFDLFYLHYIEDYESGLSFTLPSELQWSFYIEVPASFSIHNDSFEEFRERYPILKLISVTVPIDSEIPFDPDDSVQCVCKYLKAFELQDDPVRGKMEGIDRVLPKRDNKNVIKFAHLPDLPDNECHRLLQKYMKEYIKVNKLQQKLFIGYMKRRCMFMEDFPAFNFNTGATPKLGSTIMETMLEEVSEFCCIGRTTDWGAVAAKQQLVYDCSTDGGGIFHLFTVNHDAVKGKIECFKKLGIHPPPILEVHTRECLDRYLAAALSIPLDPETKHIRAIDNNAYVLTLDFFLKMLDIHERMESGIPVIIEGETGVGKTALLEMLSILWNTSFLEQYRKFLDRFGDEIKKIFNECVISQDLTSSFVALMEGTTRQQEVPIDDLLLVCKSTFKDKSGENVSFTTTIASYMKKNVRYTTIALVNVETSWKEMQNRFPENLSFTQFWQKYIHDCSDPDGESLAAFIFCLLRAEPLQTFHKLSVHSALTPVDIGNFLKPVIDQANRLSCKLSAPRKKNPVVPKVTVFFDEVNTSSCPGLLKEIIVDQTFHGTPLPDNVFIVAACNPHRGNSVILKERKYMSKVWTRGTYYVHPLHPTMKYLKWDYGALGKDQELLYVQEKMNVISREVAGDSLKQLIERLGYFSELITSSQNIMREYAEEHMKNVLKLSASEAKKASYSCVSQRDIQRVFVFLKWLMKCYQRKSFEGRFEKNIEVAEKFKTAVLVSLGLVYYMRLDDHCNRSNYESQPSYRSKYVARLCQITGESLKIDDVLKDELKFYCKMLHIPRGVAKTRALLENMFCIIACCCTRTPLIITGPPGSSKTLSFSLTLDRIKGRQSTLDPFKDFELFPSLDPLYYQCSKLTTSTEVETVFQRAIKRQSRFHEAGLPINCVVFMDEAGLPEESLESLKVLHKFLDDPEVSFVAITNHLLDASKTNRAVSLFRSNYVQDDLHTLMTECLPEVPNSLFKELCDTYYKLMEDDEEFQVFFGLRDFIYLGHYLRRNKQLNFSPQLLIQAIERNFNGYRDYDTVCQRFLSSIGSGEKE